MKGAYCLVINLGEDSTIRIGKLGEVNFDKGNYVYVGSALNSLEKRIERHLKKEKTIFWHIDYLLSNPNAMVKEVYCKKSKMKEECDIAKKVSNHGKPIKDFGSSDCGCISHLFKVENTKFLENFMEKLPLCHF